MSSASKDCTERRRRSYGNGGYSSKGLLLAVRTTARGGEAPRSGCIHESQRENNRFTRNGKPIALLVGVEGMDREQVELGQSDKFWTLIRQRRAQKVLSRAPLEKKIANGSKTESRR
ncbi:MAG TPA: hypothetical protein VKU02_31580 [Gemmataceae bacterium]|nr:hypothetical protein [Gemmataceae bacterium]